MAGEGSGRCGGAGTWERVMASAGEGGQGELGHTAGPCQDGTPAFRPVFRCSEGVRRSVRKNSSVVIEQQKVK